MLRSALRGRSGRRAPKVYQPARYHAGVTALRSLPRPRIRGPKRGRLLAALAGAVLLASCRPAPRPDVVFVLVDTLRADHLGCYGYPKPTSPHLDDLATDSVLFENAISSATWTKPAIASLFTALYPSEHGIVRQLDDSDPDLVDQVLPASLPTLAERFRAGGYATVAVVHQPNISHATGFDRGFEDFDHLRKVDDFQLVQTLLAKLDLLPAGKPVFAYLHLLDAHWPYTERLPDLPLDAFGPIDPKDRVHAERAAVRYSRRHRWRHLDLPTVEAWYDHGVAWDDRAVGELVAGLERRRRWAGTLFVVASDHGEGFLEHRRLEHGFEPYRELTHIPLLMHLPAGSGIPSGRRRSIVSLTEVGPTLLELAGLPRWEGVTGKSFADLVRGDENDARSALIEMERASAVRTLAAKLIYRRSGRLEYYDLATDPNELHNLTHKTCEGPCRQAFNLLRKIESGLQPPRKAEGSAVRLDPEDLEELKSLGYL
jgi:arylsulfatase A-like enzyme